jgi:hypothetical protein
MKIGKFKVEIYGFTIEVVVVPNTQETTKYYHKLVKRLKLPPEEDDRPCEGFAMQHGFRCWIVIAENKLSYDTITHEVSHLTLKILNFNNIHDGADNENHALLNGFINGKVFNLLLSKGYTIIDTHDAKTKRKRNSSGDREVREEDKRISEILGGEQT